MKALVIGAGFGGIAAALRLRAKGYDVSLIDRCASLWRARPDFFLSATASSTTLGQPSSPRHFCLKNSSPCSASALKTMFGWFH